MVRLLGNYNNLMDNNILNLITSGDFVISSDKKQRQFDAAVEEYLERNVLDGTTIELIIEVLDHRVFPHIDRINKMTHIINRYSANNDILLDGSTLYALFYRIPSVMINLIDKLHNIPTKLFVKLCVHSLSCDDCKNKGHQLDEPTLILLYSRLEKTDCVIHRIIKIVDEYNDYDYGNGYVHTDECDKYTALSCLPKIFNIVSLANKLNCVSNVTDIFSRSLNDTIRRINVTDSHDDVNNLLDYLLANKYIITQNDIIEVYKATNIPLIELFVTKINFTINSDIISAMLNTFKAVNDESNALNMAKIFDISTLFGYKPKLVDIKLACNKRCYFNNVASLGIPVDDILGLQVEVEYFPYTLDNNILVPYLLLYKMCSVDTITTLKKELRNHNPPNIYCLRYACTKYQNVNIITYLIEKHNLKFDSVCLANLYLCEKTNPKMIYYTKGHYVSHQIYSNNLPVKMVDPVIGLPQTVAVSGTNDNNSNTNCLVLPIVEVVKNTRHKHSLKPIVGTTLKINGNIATVMELKKKFMAHLKSNKLLVGNTIMVDTFIAQIIGDNTDGNNKYINFDDLGNLLHMCIKN